MSNVVNLLEKKKKTDKAVFLDDDINLVQSAGIFDRVFATNDFEVFLEEAKKPDVSTVFLDVHGIEFVVELGITLVEEGKRVIIHSGDEDKAEEVAKEIEKMTGKKVEHCFKLTSMRTLRKEFGT